MPLSFCFVSSHAGGASTGSASCQQESVHDAQLTTSIRHGLDSLLHTRGLCGPPQQARWSMSSSLHAASSSACIASTSPASWKQKRVDSPTRFCGLSLPMLFERISAVQVPANDTDPHPSGPAARLDNRIRMKAAKPSRRPVTVGPRRRGSVSARAGPCRLSGLGTIGQRLRMEEGLITCAFDGAANDGRLPARRCRLIVRLVRGATLAGKR